MTIAGRIKLDRIRTAIRLFTRRGLFWKYVAMFAAVLGIALVGNGLVNIWVMYAENRASLQRLQREQVIAAADKISQFVEEIEAQLGWTTHLSWEVFGREQLELDGRRLLRQVPAITELKLLDPQGRERIHLSRQAEDTVNDGDYSSTKAFETAISGKTYYGPVYFRRQTEPYMTLAVGGARRDNGVSVAEINLKHIWDVVSQIKVGESGRAYVVGPEGRLIAHPDISMVLRNTDLSQLPQVKAARGSTPGRIPPSQSALDLHGNKILTTHTVAKPLNWLVFVELPEQEANAPLYEAIATWLAVTLLGLVLALVSALLLARHMVVPIRAIADGAERIGTGALDHRIKIRTGDELEALAERFNRMAGQLQSSYAGLERKVEERTQQLRDANMAKSRFLAVASHDLRQPLHALNLFIAQLGSETGPAEQTRLKQQISSSIDSMNKLFNELLDISRLDAGALSPRIAAFPVSDVLTRISATFLSTAQDKGLHFRVVTSSAWVKSDSILLERILLNLVSNAIRYTSIGGVVVGCRRLQRGLRIDVCDTGVGIAENERRNIFNEFYRIQPDGHESGEGLGLGLAIVDRLCSLLQHPFALSSIRGKGSRFSVTLPLATESEADHAVPLASLPTSDLLSGKLVVVIDDDPLLLDGTRGLLTTWGCRVVVAASRSEAILRLNGGVPDLIISDLHLSGGETGIDAIDGLRHELGENIPGFVITGDISTGQAGKIGAKRYPLLHKPVTPMALRAMMSALLQTPPKA
jgi:signal transduction histidine kinase/CheY-like chemotaxis protein